jgi:hypothetical protein
LFAGACPRSLEKDRRVKDYNGFTSQQRDRAQRWLNAQWAGGSLARPNVCRACGQTEPPIDAHAEDYSEPFKAGVTDGYHLCFVCHMMVHCRANNPRVWERYCEMIAKGGRPKWREGRSFPKFQERFLRGGITPGQFTFHAPPTLQVLRVIELSQDQVAKGARPIGFPEAKR